MSRAISDYYEPLRAVLQDLADPPRVPDATLLKSLRTALRLGKLTVRNGASADYGLDSPLTGITPDPWGSPADSSLLVLETALMMTAPRPDSFSFRTRGYSEKHGGFKEFLDYLRGQLHELQNGAGILAWQNLGSWWEGHFGLNIWQQYTRVKVQAPLQTLNINASDGSSALSTGEGGMNMDVPVNFTLTGAAAVNDYLMGLYESPGTVAIKSVTISCKAPVLPVVLGLEQGASIVRQFTIPAGETVVRENFTLNIARGDLLRVKVLSAPDAVDSTTELVVSFRVGTRLS